MYMSPAVIVKGDFPRSTNNFWCVCFSGCCISSGSANLGFTNNFLFIFFIYKLFLTRNSSDDLDFEHAELSSSNETSILIFILSIVSSIRQYLKTFLLPHLGVLLALHRLLGMLLSVLKCIAPQLPTPVSWSQCHWCWEIEFPLQNRMTILRGPLLTQIKWLN